PAAAVAVAVRRPCSRHLDVDGGVVAEIAGIAGALRRVVAGLVPATGLPATGVAAAHTQHHAVADEHPVADEHADTHGHSDTHGHPDTDEHADPDGFGHPVAHA